MKHRRGMKTDRSCNAMTLIRTSTEIFCGAGVYTIAEVWHMAGISLMRDPFVAPRADYLQGLAPNLTEAEVFDSPSRTARLCAAYFHLAQQVHTKI